MQTHIQTHIQTYTQTEAYRIYGLPSGSSIFAMSDICCPRLYQHLLHIRPPMIVIKRVNTITNNAMIRHTITVICMLSLSVVTGVSPGLVEGLGVFPPVEAVLQKISTYLTYITTTLTKNIFNMDYKMTDKIQQVVTAILGFPQSLHKKTPIQKPPKSKINPIRQGIQQKLYISMQEMLRGTILCQQHSR